MKNLLRADFTRLIKNKFIWLSFLSVVALAFFEAYLIATDNIDLKIMLNFYYMSNICCDEYAQIFTLERIFSEEAQVIIFLILAAFVSLYIGTEFFSGGVKNKSLAGHGKLKVYLSYLIVCSVYALLLSVIFVVSALISVQLFADSEMHGDLPTKFIAGFMPYYVCAVIAISCILAMLCLIIKDRKKAILACIFAVFILIAVSICTTYIFSVCEYYFDYSIKQILPNPEYPSDFTHIVNSIITRLNPVCQTRGYLYYIWLEFDHTCFDPFHLFEGIEKYFPDLGFYPLYSLACVAVSAVGCKILSKRDDVS